MYTRTHNSHKSDQAKAFSDLQVYPLTLGLAPGLGVSLQAHRHPLQMAGRERRQGFGWEEEIRLKPVQNLWKEAAAWGDPRHGRTRDLLVFPKPDRCVTGSKLNYTAAYRFQSCQIFINIYTLTIKVYIRFVSTTARTEGFFMVSTVKAYTGTIIILTCCHLEKKRNRLNI